MRDNALIELAERCEKATGPGLNLAIFRALHPEYDGYVEGRGGLVHPSDSTDQRVLSDVRWPNYTASIDAAMTLVPTACDWTLEGGTSGERALAWLRWLDGSADGVGEAQSGLCATPALALCAAALRARASQDTAHD